MDDLDIRICQLLFNCSRRSQRELADILGISVAAVHRRVESLIEEGVIKEFTANISRSYLGAVFAQVDGICGCRSVEEVKGQLGKNGAVQSVLLSAANLTTLTLLLRDISDLGRTVEEIRTILQMQQPKVTISAQVFVGAEPFERDFSGKRELSRIDYRIINALHHNSRKLVVDIAEETGITPKTIRHHLEEMEQAGAVEYTLIWNPSYSSGANFIIRVDLRPGVDKRRYISSLNKRFGARLILTFIHGNLLDYICSYCWAPTIAQHKELIEAIMTDEEVVNVTSGIVQNEWSFDTWRDELLRERATMVKK